MCNTSLTNLHAERKGYLPRLENQGDKTEQPRASARELMGFPGAFSRRARARIPYAVMPFAGWLRISVPVSVITYSAPVVLGYY